MCEGKGWVYDYKIEVPLKPFLDVSIQYRILEGMHLFYFLEYVELFSLCEFDLKILNFIKELM